MSPPHQPGPSRHRDGDRDRHRDRHRHRHRDRDHDRDRHHHRDRDRDRDRDHDPYRDRDRDRDHDRYRERDRHSERERERDRHSEHERDRHRHRHRRRHQRPSPEKKQKQGILQSDFSEEQVRHQRSPPEKKQKQGILQSDFSQEQVLHQRSPPEKKQKRGILRSDFREEQMNGEGNINGALSDDLLSNIFDRVPVHDIYKARLVCRRWYHVTHSQNNYALLFNKYRAVFSMGTRDGRVELTKLRQQHTSVAVTDCSELCLSFAEGGGCTELILSHHSSGVILNLPSLVTRSKATPMYSWGVSCARDSMDLKVVVYIPPDPYTGVKVDEFHVLTIGEGEVDDESWRVVQAEPRVFKYKPVLITDGFMHWVLHDDNLLTMNLETEEFTESPGPDYSIGPFGEVKNTYLSTGKYLSLLRECGELYWEVWEMDPRTFAWRKTGDFSLEEHRSQFESTSKDVSIIPVGWVKYLEVLVLCADLGEKTILIYNLVKEEMEKMELPCRVCYYSIHPYEV